MTQSSVKALERRECESWEGERESKPTSDATNVHLSRAASQIWCGQSGRSLTAFASIMKKNDYDAAREKGI